jgi:hypothetical protein
MKTITTTPHQKASAGFIQQSLIAGTLLTVSLGMSILVSALIGTVTGLSTADTDSRSVSTELRIEISERTPSTKAIWTLLLPKTGSEG